MALPQVSCPLPAIPLSLTRSYIRTILQLAQAFGYLPLAFDQEIINIFFVHESVVGRVRPPRPQPSPGGKAASWFTFTGIGGKDFPEEDEDAASHLTGLLHPDSIDAEFNLVSAAETVNASLREGYMLHNDAARPWCEDRAWAHIPRGMPFSSYEKFSRVKVSIVNLTRGPAKGRAAAFQDSRAVSMHRVQSAVASSSPLTKPIGHYSFEGIFRSYFFWAFACTSGLLVLMVSIAAYIVGPNWADRSQRHGGRSSSALAGPGPDSRSSCFPTIVCKDADSKVIRRKI